MGPAINHRCGNSFCLRGSCICLLLKQSPSGYANCLTNDGFFQGMYIVLLVRYLPLLGGNSARKPDREKDERCIPGMTVFIQYPVMSTYRKKTQTFSSALLQLQYSEPQLLGVECYERISKLPNTVTNISDVGSEIKQRWTIPSREGKYQTIGL